MPTEAPSDIYANRLRRLRAAMLDSGVGVALITPGANMKYLAGYSEEGHERLLCLVVPLDGAPSLIVPAINRQHALANLGGIDDVQAWTDSEGWLPHLEAALREAHHTGETIAVDDDMPARFVVPVADIAGGEHVVLAGPLMTPLRSVKDDAEIDALRRAAVATETALIAGRAACRPGVTEREVAAAIDSAFRAAGGTPSFESIVAAGPNAAMPHHMPGETVIGDGDIVLFDIGAMLGDYRGDITRVYSVGAASKQAADVYAIVHQAQYAATNAVRPGATGADIDRAARQVIAEAGFGDKFIHRTGHGLGLDAHEEPNMSENNHTTLAAGNCFSIEPGIYLPGEFGVRLENIVIVTPTGVESLNSPIPACLEDVAKYA